MLKEYTLSDLGCKLVEDMKPGFIRAKIESSLRETAEAKQILNGPSATPLYSLNGMENILKKLGVVTALQPSELSLIKDFLVYSQRMKTFMKRAEDIAPLVASYGLSLHEMDWLVEEIDRCIKANRVDDKASSGLAKIRKKIIILEDRMKSKLDSLVKSLGNNQYLQDNIVSVREGRYVIPVKREYTKNIHGDVLDRSNTGSTVFIEPEEVKNLQRQLSQLRMEEEEEEYKILSYLTAMAEDHHRDISINVEIMANYDFIFARAKLSRQMDGNEVQLSHQQRMVIVNGRHPLLGKEAVPINLTLGLDYRGLVITGPNTGGKTVSLKTVGLMSLMVQSGLHVPLEEGSSFPIFKDILVDIGDSQSIEQSLSTFSGHLKNLIYILERVTPESLVLVDELGAGTDPGEGMGLATAILEALYKKGAIIMATSHFSEIKEFAFKSEGFENGCMEFDIHTLKPLYRLSIGKAGESNGFLIALRLGMDKRIIERAHRLTYKEDKDYSQFKLESYTKELEAVKPVALETEVIKYHTVNDYKKEKEKKVEINFKVGDCVFIRSLNRTGIVCEEANPKGEVGVMIMKKKLKINYKRLSLYIDKEELYPDNYDMDIVLESKENRKKKHDMNRKHVKDLVIHYEK
ncbi:endonuclease MutS2 [Alkaliphilus serpentinus]|uniref:Endonuclease MutS2 n=2 Tax=Alkaliphilus serpentinus TaxID=1482731 RepID=A0A833HNQ0_9FIRM|nr:endonuclease MutS2 [Alkaliphilus serpentinus]